VAGRVCVVLVVGPGEVPLSAVVGIKCRGRYLARVLIAGIEYQYRLRVYCVGEWCRYINGYYSGYSGGFLDITFLNKAGVTLSSRRIAKDTSP
jgi:hypothetical protein